MPWHVRPEGSTQTAELPTAQAVLERLADGDFAPTDQVRGPGETGWQAIEDHPQFAEAVEGLDAAVKEVAADDHIDFNPLIDVALVLLIFFILTATYSSLRRVIELPPGPPDNKGGKPTEPIKEEDVKSLSFLVKVWIEDGKTLYRLDDRPLVVEELERAMTEHVRVTNRKQMLLDVGPGVLWEDIARVYDAAKGAGLHQINRVYHK